jgi:CheY-like chemotaxis protein
MTAADEQINSILCGRRILVVEDEMMLAMLLEDLLTELGCEVFKAARIAKAFELMATAPIEAAILDVNVAGEPVYPIARALEERGIPFVFSTGYGAKGLPAEYQNRPTLSKPFQLANLAPTLAKAIQNSQV